ncbi:MAG TPA: penicillin-insensitive murein endopeptidase [Myxococcota bacterium]
MTLNVLSWLMVAALATPAAATKTAATAPVPTTASTKTSTQTAAAARPATTTTTTKAAPAPVPAELDELDADASCPEAEGVADADPNAEDADVAENDGDAVANAEAGKELAPDGEADIIDPNAPVIDINRYTLDVSDDQLKASWAQDPKLLGPVSIGFTNAGRLINGVPFPSGGNWLVVDPEGSYGTQETIDFVLAAMRQVEERFPNTPALRINHIAKKDGGYLRPHRSHQSGRDVDIGFYYPTADPVRVRARENHIDVARNWAFIRAIITETDVQFILVDRRVQKVLRAHAESIGENRQWVESLFSGTDPMIRHARGHRDHFHVRFFNARAQELGRRVQPLLSLVPEQNLTTHRVKRGDTLGHIARRYGTSVNALKRANGLKSSALRVGRTLTIPLRGPCTSCPVPPPLVIPPRRLPPVEVIASSRTAPHAIRHDAADVRDPGANVVIAASNDDVVAATVEPGHATICSGK